MPTTSEMLYGVKPADWRPSLLEAQRLHIEAASAGKGELYRFMWLEFGKFSTKELTWPEYRRTQDWIEKQGG